MNHDQKHSCSLIGQRMRLRMATAHFGMQLFFTGLFAFALYCYIECDMQNGLVNYESLSQMLLPIMAIISIFSALLSLILSSVFMRLLSRSLDSVMYRFTAVLDALAERRFESFRSLPPSNQMNEVTASLDKAMETVRGDIQDVRLELSRARSDLAKGDMSGLTDRLDTLDLMLLRWEGVQQNP